MTPPAVAAASPPRGHILHDQLEARVLPRIVGPLGPGNLQYAAMWKTAQRLTTKPVKFGTILPELLAAAVADDYYKDPVERCWAFSEALNTELNSLADAGCPVIQLEEPQIHMVPARGKPFGRLETAEFVKLFNNTVKGLRIKTEVWCHTCWGNPAQQRIFRDVQSYQPTLAALNEVDADVMTFETCSSGTGDLRQSAGLSPTRRSSSASSTITRCRSSGRPGRRPDPRGPAAHPARAARHLFRLRHGP